jgi:hypothetical protein
VFLGLVQQQDTIIVQDANDSTLYQTWTVSANITVYPNAWVVIPVTYVGGGASFAASHQVILIIKSAGALGLTGPTGPAGVQRPLQSVSYYLTAPIAVSTGTPAMITYDTLDAANSYGTVGFSYSSGILTSSSNLTILISGQVTTDNRSFDVTVAQPTIIVSKGSNAMLTSSVINFQGSSFSTTIVLGNADTVSVFYAHSFSSTVNVLAGQYVTRVTFTQLDAVQAFAVAPSMSIVPANGNATQQLIAPINRGSTFLVTATSNSLHGLSSSLGVEDSNLYVYIKNASAFTITMCNVTATNPTLAASAPQAIVYWTGTAFTMYA